MPRFVPKILEKMGLQQSENRYPYKVAKYRETTSRQYVEFWVWSPDHGELKRKRTYSGLGKTAVEKRRNGKKLAKEINKLLA